MTKIGPFTRYLTSFSEEIVSYHLMRNKVYLICLSSNKKISIYNVMKLKKIKELTGITLEKVIELLEPFDKVTLKSWFTVDIKLGVLSLIFNKDALHSNPFNFEINYLEKLFEKNNIENDLSNLKLPISFQYNSNSQTKGFDKSNSTGFHLIQQIFSNVLTNSLNHYREFFENNFYDTTGYIKRKYLNSINSINPSQLLNSFLIYSTHDSSISLAGYSCDKIKNMFIIPSFLKEIIQMVNYNIIQPIDINITNFNKKQEKIEIVIDNQRKDFKNKNQSQNSNNYRDELEANNNVIVEKFKIWLMKSYIEEEHFRNMINGDLNNLVIIKKINEKQVKMYIIQKDYIIQKYLSNSIIFIDFIMKDGVVKIDLIRL